MKQTPNQLKIKKGTLRFLLDAFSRSHILVVGDAMLDEYHWGTVSRISPEAPIPVVDVQRTSYVPGGAANVAANIAALGGKVTLLGFIGQDEAGMRLYEELVQRGISVEHLISENVRPTTIKTRVIAHSQQVVRVDREKRGPLPAELASALKQRAGALIPEVNVVLLSDYAKGVLTADLTQSVIQTAREYSKGVVVDPKGADYSKYRNATIVTPNLMEASRATKIEVSGEADIQLVGQQLLHELETEAILITCGDQGMWLFESHKQALHLAPEAREVYDVTGAGDTVVGTLALALASGASPAAAAQIANHAAGIVVGKVGTATPTPEELAKTLLRGD